MLTFTNSVTFVRGEMPPVVLRNFHEPEDGFVWGTSRWAEIIFPFSNKEGMTELRADLVLDLDVFKSPPELKYQTILIYLNGLRIGSLDIYDRSTSVVPFGFNLLKQAENILTFDTPNATVPHQFGIPDDRLLSIQLFSLQIRPGG
jgi:hypothetical protein